MVQEGGFTLQWGTGEKPQVYPLLRGLFPSYAIPTDTAIGYTPQGKPYLVDDPNHHISVSHSGQYLFCGIGTDPIGVDIEQIKPRKEQLASRVLSPEEYQWFQQQGSNWEDFYSLWVLKEALLKCQGTGISRSLKEVSVPLLKVGEHSLWQGYEFYLYGAEDYRAGVCMNLVHHPVDL